MKKLFYTCACGFLLAFTLLFSIFTTANNVKFYNWQYQKNNTTIATGVSYENLEEITVLLLDYLNNKRADLAMQTEKFGQINEVFDQREKDHMVDVKVLYNRVKMVMYFCLLFAGVLFLIGFSKEKSTFLKDRWLGYKTALFAAGILIVCLGLVFAFGFDWFWVQFHHVFFNNDLWLLDPAISTMINMFPLEFFFSMCAAILAKFALFCTAFAFLFAPKNKKTKSKIANLCF